MRGTPLIAALLLAQASDQMPLVREPPTSQGGSGALAPVPLGYDAADAGGVALESPDAGAPYPWAQSPEVPAAGVAVGAAGEADAGRSAAEIAEPAVEAAGAPDAGLVAPEARAGQAPPAKKTPAKTPLEKQQEALRQQVEDLEQRVAEEDAQLDESRQELERVAQEQAAMQARQQAIAQSRERRAAWLSEADGLLRSAMEAMQFGSFDVLPDIGTAEFLLQRSLGEAGTFGGEAEQLQLEQALEILGEARAQLANDDLFHGRAFVARAVELTTNARQAIDQVTEVQQEANEFGLPEFRPPLP